MFCQHNSNSSKYLSAYDRRVYPLKVVDAYPVQTASGCHNTRPQSNSVSAIQDLINQHFREQAENIKLKSWSKVCSVDPDLESMFDVE